MSGQEIRGSGENSSSNYRDLQLFEVVPVLAFLERVPSRSAESRIICHVSDVHFNATRIGSESEKAGDFIRRAQKRSIEIDWTVHDL